jgi:hypothetical protein
MTSFESLVESIISFIKRFFLTLYVLLFKPSFVQTSIKTNRFHYIISPSVFFSLCVLFLIIGLKAFDDVSTNNEFFKKDIGNSLYEFVSSVADFGFIDTTLYFITSVLCFHFLLFVLNAAFTTSKSSSRAFKDLMFYYSGTALLLALLIAFIIHWLNLISIHKYSSFVNITTAVGLLLLLVGGYSFIAIRLVLIGTKFTTKRRETFKLVVGLALCLVSFFLVFRIHSLFKNNVIRFKEPTVFFISDDIYRQTDQFILDVAESPRGDVFSLDLILVNNDDDPIHIDTNVGFLTIKDVASNEQFFFGLYSRNDSSRFIRIESKELMELHFKSSDSLKAIYPKLNNKTIKELNFEYIQNGNRETVVQPIDKLLFR